MRLILPPTLLIAIFISTFLFSHFKSVNAQSLDQQILDITTQIQALETAIVPLKKETDGLSQKIRLAQNQIQSIQKTILFTDTSLLKTEETLSNQELLYKERLTKYYKNTTVYSPLSIFLTTVGNSTLRQYFVLQNILKKDQLNIAKYITQMEHLLAAKNDLSQNQTKLLSLKKSLESRFGFLEGEIKKAENYKQQLSKKQKDLISQKESLLSTSVGDVSSSVDPNSRADYDPGFRPAFAAFSFGAPHRKGMSQYGAYARAKDGQTAETILKAYYGNIKIEKREVFGDINTPSGNLPFEDNYLVGIAEMPSKWGDDKGMEALKAQAIAARTYALNYTDSLKKPICITEACQVYSVARKNNPGAWKKAVEETRGLVVISNTTGNIFSTLYASTSGGSTYSYTSQGHTTPSIWDTKCSSGSCWPDQAWEKQIPSPWFYKGWYKTRSGVSSGRLHPWLTQSEFSDIINALIYFTKTGDSSHLSQVQNCLSICDPSAWSGEELSRQLNDKGGSVTKINSIKTNFGNNGQVASVDVGTDKGNLSFKGEDFKEIFSIRAPGALHIKSMLFNIEKK